MDYILVKKNPPALVRFPILLSDRVNSELWRRKSVLILPLLGPGIPRGHPVPQESGVNPCFYEKVRDIFLNLDNDYFILCGDFNLVLNPLLDTENYRNVNNPKARDKVLELMKDLQLVDYYRILNPSKKVFTWRKRNPLKQGRLDYILISESLSNMVETISIKPGYRSDHSSVLLELKFNKFIRGRGLWKFNNSLLTDKTFIEKVKQTILKVQDQYLQDDDINHSIFLEVLLMEIRSITISYSSFKKKEREKIEITLLKDIENIESQSDIDFGLLHEKKVELEKVRKEKLQGHIIRSRAKWVEEGEKPSKYFCSLESRNFLNKTIKKVETHNNNIIYDQCDILHQVKIFYESLFSCKDSDLLDINLEDIIKTDIPRLDTSTSYPLKATYWKVRFIMF